MSSPSDLVSPSGKSIFESVITGETDPTVPEFQKGRENIASGVSNFFSIFGKPCIDNIPIISKLPCWVLVLLMILVLIAIIMIKK